MRRTRPIRTPRTFAGLLVGFFLSLGCSDSGGGDGPSCVSGEQVLCPCADGSSGVQVCAAGSFGLCQCGDLPDSNGTSGSGEASSSGSTTDAPVTTTEPPGDCGNGIEDAGECPDVCPQDCAAVESTGEPACVAFAGLVDNVPSVWQEQGSTGFAAGGLKCTAIGADHVCDYGELVTAEAGGVLETLGVGTTMWMHRVSPAMDAGTTYPADLGGRCVDWSYAANELADGEYVEVTGKGVVFHFDEDPFYDGIDPSHAAPDMLPCGEVLRSIPCCNAACE